MNQGARQEGSCPKGKRPRCWGTWAELSQLKALRKGTKGSRLHVFFLERERVQGTTWRKVGDRKMEAFPDWASPQAGPMGGRGSLQEGNS